MFLRSNNVRVERLLASFIPRAIHPNHLTTFRLLVIPFLILAEIHHLSAKLIFLLVILAGLSDFFDGVLARSRDQVTRIGTILDPTADKLLSIVVIWILYSRDLLSGKLIFLILLAESHILIIPCLSFLYRFLSGHVTTEPFKIIPNIFGKLKFTCLIFSFSLLLFGEAFDIVWAKTLGHFLATLGVSLGMVAVYKYIASWIKEKY